MKIASSLLVRANIKIMYTSMLSCKVCKLDIELIEQITNRTNFGAFQSPSFLVYDNFSNLAYPTRDWNVMEAATGHLKTKHVIRAIF